MDLRWNWDDPDDADDTDDRYRYAFIIDAFGGGHYYDFRYGEKDEDGRRTAPPREVFTCRREASTTESN